MRTRLAFLALVLCTLTAAAEGPADALQQFSRFVAAYYGPSIPITERQITFTAPLEGNPVTFRHFEWEVVARDQYGRKESDLVSGLVRYDAAGNIELLVVGGPAVGTARLRQVREEIERTGEWPKRVKAPFGPDAASERIGDRASAAAHQLLGGELTVKTCAFQLKNPGGGPDGTWHVVLRAANTDGPVIAVRLEPFSGKLIELERRS